MRLQDDRDNNHNSDKHDVAFLFARIVDNPLLQHPLIYNGSVACDLLLLTAWFLVKPFYTFKYFII